VNHLDPRPRQRNFLADANPLDEETARLAYLQRGAGPHFQADPVLTLHIRQLPFAFPFLFSSGQPRDSA